MDGWTPVINNHSRIVGDGGRKTNIWFTLFVGNLPEEMDEEWMNQIFTGAGEVKDTYIPKKRSIFQNQKFGFVRYNTKEEGFRAIKMWNAAIIRDHKMVVKFARFSGAQEHHTNSQSQYQIKGKKVIQNHQQNETFGKATHLRQSEFSKQGENRQEMEYRVVNKRSFAQVLKGGEDQVFQSIQVFASGNGWLFRSAIAKIRRLMSAEDLVKVFKSEDVHNVEIKAIGGRFVIITFPDSESRDATIKENWITNWFEEIKPWNGEQAKDERFVWLSCFGMPLHAWSVPTFKEIGNKWGHFIEVDDNTLKESSYEKGRILIATEHGGRIAGNIQLCVDGKNFIVRIEEDETFRIVKSSKLPISKAVHNEKDEEDDTKDGVENNSAEVEKNNEVEAIKADRGKNIALVEHGEGPKPAIQDFGEGDMREIVDPDFPILSGKDEMSAFDETPCLIGIQDIDADPLLSRPPLFASDELISIAKETAVSSGSDDSQSADLISSDPLINYVEFKRHKKKAQDKHGFRRKPLWTKNPLKAAIFSRTNNRGQKEKNLKKGCVDGPSFSSEVDSSSDIRKRYAILIKEARESMEINASLGVKFFGRETYNIKKFLELEGVEITEQEIIALDKVEESSSISVEF